jgi:hypothetical protein
MVGSARSYRGRRHLLTMRSSNVVVDDGANLSWWLGKPPERSRSSSVPR